MISRRVFVKVGGLWVATIATGAEIGCSKGAAPPPPVSPPSPGGAAGGAASAPTAATPYGMPAPEVARPSLKGEPSTGCIETASNIEGPYYRAGAPLRTDLADAATKGTRIVVHGRVLATDCETPIAGAVIDLWQADAEGRYDNDGHTGRVPGPLMLRGKQSSTAEGMYAFRSILPGHYLNGPQYRPAHVHAKVSAPGYRTLTTQLYFDGDPYNAIDPFIRAGLVMKMSDSPGGVKETHFDFVLVKA